MSKRTATTVQRGSKKQSTFKQDGLSKSRMEYLQKFCEEFLDMPKVSQTVIVRRALEFYANNMPLQIRNLEHGKLVERKALRIASLNCPSFFGPEGIGRLSDDNDQPLNYMELAGREVNRKNDQLSELSNNEQPRGMINND